MRVSDFDQRATPEILLILDAKMIFVAVKTVCGGNGIQWRQSQPGLVVDVDQEVGEQNIGWPKVPLRVHQVAAGPSAARVFAARKSGHHGLAILRNKGVGEPCASADNRSGDPEPGIPVSEPYALLDVEPGNKVCCRVVERV